MTETATLPGLETVDPPVPQGEPRRWIERGRPAVHVHETVDVRVQAAETGRQLRRKHVDGALREIHRGSAIVPLAIEGASLLDVMRHIGDVDAEIPAAAGNAFAVESVTV